MNTENLTNSTVKEAIEALQAGGKETRLSFFSDDAVFTDDGNERDLKAFFDNAFNHEEKFLTLDKVENDGKNLTGDFYAGRWATFKVYFNFHLKEDKIERLDIGQVSKR
ncbi:MAG: nuclear transport factor 2 family protein [Bacteroidota bacterium]